MTWCSSLCRNLTTVSNALDRLALQLSIVPGPSVPVMRVASQQWQILHGAVLRIVWVVRNDHCCHVTTTGISSGKPTSCTSYQPCSFQKPPTGFKVVVRNEQVRFAH